MPSRQVFLRNNWTADWALIDHANFRMTTSLDQLATRASLSVLPAVERIDETATTNVFRVYSEIKAVDIADDASEVNRFHGFILNPEPTIQGLSFACTCPVGLLEKQRADMGTQAADIIRIGTADDPVVFKKITEFGEDRWVPDSTVAGYANLFIGGVPANGRRTWKAIGRVKDTGALDVDPLDGSPWYPDKVIPPGKYAIGSDLLNYLQFNSYTPEPSPPDDITVDFVMVYVEGTNQIEEVALSLFKVALADGGLELIENVHYILAGAGQSIFPSDITINEWKWREEDGTLLEALENILEKFAPPNYRVTWDHEAMMLWMGYVELDTGAAVTLPVISYDRTLPRDEKPFFSKIVVTGVNEHPKNELDAATIDVLDSEWPVGWAIDPLNSNIENLKDFDVETSHRIWYDHNNSPPQADIKYWPLYHIRLTEPMPIERLRLWAMNSRREFKFGIRIEAHNDAGFDAYDANAPWEPLHADLFDKEIAPYEEVDASSSFMMSEVRRILISMKPAKIHLRFRYAAGLSDLQLIRRNTVMGQAYIIEGVPEGEWGTFTGVGTNDGYMTLKLDQLREQITSRAAVANKLVVGQRTAHYENKSLSNTNQCALEAARILLETVRDQRTVGFRTPTNNALKQFKTIRFKDPYWGIERYGLIEALDVQENDIALDVTVFGFSDAMPAGAWTGEEPDAL